MVERGIDLLALADFRLVAAHGGFGRAARITGRSKATLSRRVRDLEASLGRRLVERSGSTFDLTEDGRTLLFNSNGPLDELDALADAFRAGESEPYGNLRVSVPLILGQLALGLLAVRFREAHPLVTLEIVCEDRHVDLLREGYHAAIRVNPQTNEELAGRLLLRERLHIVAPVSFGSPDDTANAVELPAIVRVSGWGDGPWRFQDGDRIRTVHPKPVLRLSTVVMIRDAVLAGGGAALLPEFLVREHVAAGRLRQWGLVEDYHIETWVVHASRRLVSAKVRAFVDFLFQTFPDHSFENGLARLERG